MPEGANDIATVDGSPSWWTNPEADEVEGYDLLKDEALFSVVGVPFMVTSVTFRDGIQRDGKPYRDDYCSLELTVAPPQVFRASRDRIQSRRTAAQVAGLAIALPEEQLVINDGSTGIYRQIMQYLSAKGLITLPEGEEEGEKGDSIYDLPRSQWIMGADKASDGIDITLRCSRGLRFSEYDNPTGAGKSRTWYIA